MKKEKETQIKEIEGNLIKIFGRFGKHNEYAEFRLEHRRISFVAQKTGDSGWYVYKVWPGKKGKIETLYHGLTREKAMWLAKGECLNFG